MNLSEIENGYDKLGFNRSGIHKITRTNYNENGWDWHYNHKDTGNGFAPDGFNYSGYDKEKYDRSGYNRYGYNREGYNSKGLNSDGYNKDGFNVFGFDINGIHKDTGTFYSNAGFDKNHDHIKTGTKSAPNGYNIRGWDKDGYDIFECYRNTGFNKDGIHKETGEYREGYDFNKDKRDKRNKARRERRAELKCLAEAQAYDALLIELKPAHEAFEAYIEAVINEAIKEYMVNAVSLYNKLFIEKNVPPFFFEAHLVKDACFSNTYASKYVAFASALEKDHPCDIDTFYNDFNKYVYDNEYNSAQHVHYSRYYDGFRCSFRERRAEEDTLHAFISGYNENDYEEDKDYEF